MFINYFQYKKKWFVNYIYFFQKLLIKNENIYIFFSKLEIRLANWEKKVE